MMLPKSILSPVQMNPPTLTVKKNGDSYSLHWETEKMPYSHIGHKFEVQYKRKTDSWEVRSRTWGKL